MILGLPSEAGVAVLAAIGAVMAAVVSVLATQIWNSREWVRQQRQETYLEYVRAFHKLRREAGRSRYGRPMVLRPSAQSTSKST